MSMHVLTFNIRYDEPEDGANDWAHRRELTIATIRDHDPDLIGLQEPTALQWNDVCAALPGHNAFGLALDEWDQVEPRGGLYRTNRFDAIDEGIFWLSDTPSVPHSITWPNDWGARSCAWI